MSKYVSKEMHWSKTISHFPFPTEKSPSKIKTFFIPTQVMLLGKALRLKLLSKK